MVKGGTLTGNLGLKSTAEGEANDLAHDGDSSVDGSDVAESIFSRESADSGHYSNLSQDDLDIAISEFADLISTDTQLTGLLREGTEKAGIGPARLTDNLRRLIKILGDDLKKESSNDDQLIAAMFIRSSARPIAQFARRDFDPDNNDGLTLHQWKDLTEPMREDRINRLLGARRHIEEAHDSDSSDEEIQGHDPMNNGKRDQVPVIYALREFILSSAAWISFVKGLRRFVETPRITSTSQTVSERILTRIDPVLVDFVRQRAVFRVFWELRQFVEAELEGCWDICPMLTLSGTVRRAFATTAEEYVKTFFQEYGLSVLRLVQDAMSGKRGERVSALSIRTPIANTTR